jgi:hypothetical protein
MMELSGFIRRDKMNDISSFIIMTIIITLLIIIFSILLFKNKRILLPLIILTLSIVLLITSFSVGSWEGLGLGVFSSSLFIASFISLVLLVFYEAFKLNKKRAHGIK